MSMERMRDEPLRAVPKPERAKKVNAKRRGKAAEKRVATTLGGKLTPSSGSGIVKGDVRVEDIFPHLFVEVKYVGERVGRGAGSVSFDREWMTKTLKDAEAAGCLPLVMLKFSDGHGVYCADAKVFEQLIRALRDAQEQAKALEEELLVALRKPRGGTRFA